MFNKKYKKTLEGLMVIIAVLIIISMVVLYLPIFRE